MAPYDPFDGGRQDRYDFIDKVYPPFFPSNWIAKGISNLAFKGSEPGSTFDESSLDITPAKTMPKSGNSLHHKIVGAVVTAGGKAALNALNDHVQGNSTPTTSSVKSVASELDHIPSDEVGPPKKRAREEVTTVMQGGNPTPGNNAASVDDTGIDKFSIPTGPEYQPYTYEIIMLQTTRAFYIESSGWDIELGATAIGPDNAVGGPHTITTHPWYMLPVNFEAFYWTQRDLHKFSLPGRVSITALTRGYELHNAQMQLTQTQADGFSATVDKPMWRSYKDQHRYLWPGHTCPTTNSRIYTPNSDGDVNMSANPMKPTILQNYKHWNWRTGTAGLDTSGANTLQNIIPYTKDDLLIPFESLGGCTYHNIGDTISDTINTVSAPSRQEPIGTASVGDEFFVGTVMPHSKDHTPYMKAGNTLETNENPVAPNIPTVKASKMFSEVLIKLPQVEGDSGFLVNGRLDFQITFQSTWKVTCCNSIQNSCEVPHGNLRMFTGSNTYTARDLTEYFRVTTPNGELMKQAAEVNYPATTDKSYAAVGPNSKSTHRYMY